MVTITAAQVKELRETTGVGMMECKKALTENQGDMDKAILWLRERGMSRAAQKAGRTAAEGVVQFAISASRREAVVVEVNCETDFAAKNQDFRAFVGKVAKLALDQKINNIEDLKAAALDGTSVAASLTNLIAKVGENMTLRRLAVLSSPDGFVVGYNHMDGKIAALVALTGPVSEDSLALGADLAMHVAASSPRYFSREEVGTAELDQEKDIIRKKLQEQGKASDIIEKALLGQVNKFYGEVCFIDQAFVKEPKLSVGQYVKQTGLTVQPRAFVRFQLGEGIEVKEQNFAEEVAAQLKNR